MAHVRVTRDDLPGVIKVGLPYQQLTLSEEEAGELATRLLGLLGCSFEIKWPHLQPDPEERMAQQLAARRRLIEDAETYADGHTPTLLVEGYDEDVRDRLKQAYLAGWTASPKPVTTIIR